MSEKEFLKKLGKKILTQRESLGLSREQLAEKIDLSRMHIYRIETAEGKPPHSPTISVLRKIAKALDLNLSELVDVD